jgi:hypothetical protein
MSQKPTTNTRVIIKVASMVTVMAGIATILTGMLSIPLSLETMAWGAVVTGAGQVVSAFAE